MRWKNLFWQQLFSRRLSVYVKAVSRKDGSVCMETTGSILVEVIKKLSDTFKERIIVRYNHAA